VASPPPPDPREEERQPTMAQRTTQMIAREANAIKQVDLIELRIEKVGFFE
jgi:hypothetical protein